MSSVIVAFATAEVCNCWEGYKVSKDPRGAYCKSDTHGFPCNIEKPPTCTCILSATGKEITLPFGELHCLGIEKTYAQRLCKPEDEWNKWLDAHREFRLYD